MENLNISREELVLNDLGGIKWLHITKPYAHANDKKAILQLLDITIVSAILIFLSFYVLQQNSIILTIVGYISWICIGLLTARLFIVQHDAGHGSFFSSKLANNIIGLLCGFLTCVPYNYWKAEHAFHHGNVGALETITIGDIKTRTDGNCLYYCLFAITFRSREKCKEIYVDSLHRDIASHNFLWYSNLLYR